MDMERIEADIRSTALREGIGRFVVGGVILSRGRILLLKRKADDFMPGIYELPSGRVEGAETFHAALERELAEETGLVIARILGLVDRFDYSSKSGTATRQINYLVSVLPFAQILLSEHADYAWAGPDLEGLEITPQVRTTVTAGFRLGSASRGPEP